MATALDLLMSTKEDVNLLSEESNICTIDAKTRIIFVPSTIVVGGVQSDKNAERIKFSCPKIVGDNLDLSKFSVRINFENVSSLDFNVSIKDQYICDDVAVDGENVTFSWLIGRNAARYMGTVRFIVCAVKTDSDSNISVEWNTAIAEVPVLEGIEIDQPQIGQEEKDVINQLLELTKNTSAEAVQNVNSAKEQAIKDIQSVSQPDTTLTIEGGLAEAKATGEAIGSLKEDLGTPKSIKSSWFNAPYTCYPLRGINSLFTTPSFANEYPFGTFVAKTEYESGTITTTGENIILKYTFTSALKVGETNGLCAIIENNGDRTHDITIYDNNDGAFGKNLYNGPIEKGYNIIPLADNAYSSDCMFIEFNNTTSIGSAELNRIKFSLGKVENIVYPNNMSGLYVNGSPYTCYPMSEMICMFSTPAFNKKYPFGTFVANTEYTDGTVTVSNDAITLRYQFTNTIPVGTTKGLCAIIENNGDTSYNITIYDDNNGLLGNSLFIGTIEKGYNIIPLADNEYVSHYLYLIINGHNSISATELSSIKFSLGKVPIPEPSVTKQSVAFIGDSLTAQGYYNKMKSHKFVYDVYAIGGQSIGEILSRTNTIDLRIVSPNIISNNAELTFANGAPINNQGDGNIGTLTLNGNNFNIEYTNDDKVIAKNVSSSFANNGETIKTNICEKEYTLYVYWCGTNNMQGGHVEYFIQSFEQIIAARPNSLILGITWDTSNMGLELVKAIDEYATKKFGNRFLPLHDNLVKYGLSYNGLTPSSEDAEAIKKNLIPPSLRKDQIHINEYGQTYVAHLVQERMRTLGVN